MRTKLRLFSGCVLVAAVAVTYGGALARGNEGSSPNRISKAPRVASVDAATVERPTTPPGGGSGFTVVDAATTPPNDDFANAAVISGPSGSAIGTTVDATDQQDEPLSLGGGAIPTGKTVWWRWTATAGGTFTFDTKGSGGGADLDTVLGIFTGPDLAHLTEEAANDDESSQTNTSMLHRSVTSGTTYYIQVGTLEGDFEGPITLNWGPTPANDDFDGAMILAGSSGSRNGTEVGASIDSGHDEPSLGGTIDRTVWYAWTPPPGVAIVNLTPTSASSLAVYSAGSDEDLIASNSGTSTLGVSFATDGTTTYRVQIAVLKPSSPGAFVLAYALATAPGAPTLTAALGVNASVQLAWSPPASNGGSAIVHYRLYRGTSPGAETLLTELGSGTSYTDAGLTNGLTYYYRVAAVTGAGEGAASNERSATPVVATAPGAPTLTSATAVSGQVTLAWTPPASDGGSAITEYRIYRSTTSGGEAFIDTAPVGTGYVDNTVANGVTYFYKVAAANAVGAGGLSNEKAATPSVVATVPGQPVLGPAAIGDRSVILSWLTPVSGGSAITGYRIYRGGTSGGGTLIATVGLVNTFSDSNLTNGTTYYYSVTARNAIGEGGFSEERAATPLTTPGAPSLTATAGNAMVSLAWTPPASSGGAAVGAYNVYRSASGSPDVLLTSVDSSFLSYEDDTAVNGIVYVYKVAAVNVAGVGAKSSGSTAAPATVPSAPVLSPLAPSNGSVVLTWSPPSSNGSPISGYTVYRSTGAGLSAPLATVGVVTTYTDTSVSNGTIYDYRITAANAIGEGPGSNIGTAVPTATRYGAPSWWNGDCDANWWNPHAAQQGWFGDGAHRLGASYLGIPVCGPRPGTDVAPSVAWNHGGSPIGEWSSGEYAYRFMEQVYGVTPYAAAPKDIVRSYNPGVGGGLVFVANGTVGFAPQAGDVISFDSEDGIGLAGVVGWVGMDAGGNGELRLIAQNDAGAGWRRLSVINWNVVGFNLNTAYGWLHDPQGRGVGATTSTPGLGVRSDPEAPTTVLPRPITPDPPNTTRRPPQP